MLESARSSIEYLGKTYTPLWMFNFLKPGTGLPPEKTALPTHIDNGVLDLFERIVERSHLEIGRVTEVYKWVAGILSLIVTTGIVTAGYVSYKNIADIRKDVTAEESRLQDHLDTESEQKYIDVQKAVTARVDQDFDTENIQKLVGNVATQRVTQIADPIIQAEVDKLVREKTKEIDDRVTAANRDVAVSIDKVRAALEVSAASTGQAKNSADFVTTAFAATQDDRDAFDKLLPRLNDPSNDGIVPRTLMNIAFGFENPFDINYNIDWNSAKVDPNKSTLDELKAVFNGGAFDAHIRPDVLTAICSQSRFSKYEKLQFLAEVMKNDWSLRAVARAERLMEPEAKINNNILGYPNYLKWWDLHKDEYLRAANAKPLASPSPKASPSLKVSSPNSGSK